MQYLLLSLFILPIINILTISIGKLQTARIKFLISISFSILSIISTLSIYLLNSNMNLYNQQGYYETYLNTEFLLSNLSLWLIIMVNLLMTIIYLIGYKTISSNIILYLNSIISINIFSISVFLTYSLLLFYLSFEIVLIPMFILIGFYGSRNRKITAAYSLFIYTLLGSLFFKISIIYILSSTGTLSYIVILNNKFALYQEYILWLFFLISFAVKVPLIPVHLWLPEAHVEAPTTGSVILAAILLKFGTYGLIRFSLPLFPRASQDLAGIVITLSIISVLYSSLTPLHLSDLKKIIAYSSIGHMGLATAGIFVSSIYAEIASIHFLISHAIISSALFILIGIIYDRYHTRTLFYYRGLIMIYPLYGIFFLLFSLGNISFPLTSSFISEFFIFLGFMNISPFLASLTALSILLVPCYSIWLYHRMFYGSLTRYLPVIYTDLTIKELNVLSILFILMLYLGIIPSSLLKDLVISLTS